MSSIRTHRWRRVSALLLAAASLVAAAP
ncbi:MAG: hypothetical protein RJA98_3292, partial [Pseudomonadota bacterium]